MITVNNLNLNNEIISEEILSNLQSLINEVLNPIEKKFGRLFITSGFRSVEYNKKCGGSTNSQHCKGEAVDFTFNDIGKNAAAFIWIKNNLKFDQLIDEHNFRWIHISFRNKKNRLQVLHL